MARRITNPYPREVMDWLEIQFWRVAKWLIRRGYGADCEFSDLEDYQNLTAEMVFADSRCQSCRAKEIIQWIDEHIQLLR